MTITGLGVFKSKQPRHAQDHLQVAHRLSGAIVAVTQQLAALRLDCAPSVHDYPAATLKQLLHRAKSHLMAIHAEIERCSLAPGVAIAATVEVKTLYAPLNARFLEDKIQQICDIYRDLISQDAFKQKESESVLEMVSDIFSQCFLHLASYFWQQSQTKCPSGWPLSAAQKNLASQFAHVFERFECARDAVHYSVPYPDTSPVQLT
jgi:hypothetical protein